MATILTAQQTGLIRATFDEVVPIADQAAALFYRRLFELDPALRPLFSSDLAQQSKKLMAALATVVACSDDPRRLGAVLEPLAVRHVRYGVEERHYAVVGEALLWTLERGLGDAFTDSVREAWTTAFEIISTIMIAAARADLLLKSA